MPVRVAVVVTIFVASLATQVASACDRGTLNCGPTTAGEFVPRSGVFAVAADPVMGRFIFSSFRWSAASEMLALQGNEAFAIFRTLEPDVLTESDETYVGAIKQHASLTAPMVVRYEKLPHAYVDTSVLDTTPTPTIGSACAEEFASGVWYYSLAAVEDGSVVSSPVGLRFQLGTWLPADGLCVHFPTIPRIEGPPIRFFANAPYCIYSCCSETEPSENNVIVVQPEELLAPGCTSWTWPERTLRRCGPEFCENGADDDWDLLVDCADPDCACYGCGSLPGWYCLSPIDVGFCDAGAATLSQTCATECTREPFGTHDHCEGEAAPCLTTCNTATAAGFYCCDDSLLAWCGSGHIGAVTECTTSCVREAPGTDDHCAE